MINIEIPHQPTVTIENVILDINGTITKDGKLIRGVYHRINRLRRLFRLYLLSCDTLGTARNLAKKLKVDLIPVVSLTGDCTADDKIHSVGSISMNRTAVIGNGNSDVLLLNSAALAITVIGPEGATKDAIANANIIVTNILIGLDLLIYPKRIIATVRGKANEK